MGSGENDGEAADNEKPRHRVTISKPFYLGKYEVTQAQWEAVMGSSPSSFSPWRRCAWRPGRTASWSWTTRSSPPSCASEARAWPAV